MSYQKIREEQVKVRKEHICIWCGEGIDKGEEAIYRVYTFDGDFQTDYLHPECYDALGRTSIYSLDNDGFLPGEFLRGLSAEESSRLPKDPIKNWNNSFSNFNFKKKIKKIWNKIKYFLRQRKYNE